MSFTSKFSPKSRPDPVRQPKPPQSSSEPPPPPSYSAHADDSASSDEEEEQIFHDAHFPPEEEASLLAESHNTKAEANSLFSFARYSEAISTYDKALASCPNYLDYEVAVLKSNIAACHIKLEEWKQAIEAANSALEALDREDPPPPEKKKEEEDDNKGNKSAKGAKDGSDTRTMNGKAKTGKGGPPKETTPDPNAAVVELDSDDEDASAALEKLKISDARRADISRIRAKALMRRARARSMQPSWADLAGAQEDYTRLSTDPRLSAILPASDMKVVRAGLRELPVRVNAAKEKEMGEMMGKLKDLGNGILKPFGLSTDNFKMVKDENTGGYSMSFEQGAGGKK